MQSSVAGLAKQRGHKATIWRLLDEGRQAINEPNPSHQKMAQAEDALDIANKLGLDDVQRALYQQLHEKIQQGRNRSREKTASAPFHEGSMAMVPAGEFTMGSAMGEADEQPEHHV